MPVLLDRAKASFEKIRKELMPRAAFSWQTLIALCLFSYLMAALVSPLVREFLSTCGWVFLMAGVGWATTEHPVKIPNWSLNLGPWITGALVSIFLFRGLFAQSINLALVSWPLISVVIATLPKFLSDSYKFKVPQAKDRQVILILVLANIVLSCWFQFHFTIQEWSRDYPSLTTEGVGRSNFVVQFNFGAQPSQGQTFLDQAKSVIEANINRRPWPEVERWLFDLKQTPQILEQEMRRQNLSQNPKTLPESFLWTISPQILPGNPNNPNSYILQVFSQWKGPSPGNQGYYLSLSCTIAPVSSQSRFPVPGLITEGDDRPTVSKAGSIAEPARNSPITDSGDVIVGRVSCGPATDRIPGPPPISSQAGQTP